MEQQLVSIISGIPLTDTQVVATSFGMRHAKVMEVLNSLLSEYEDLSVLSKDSKITPSESGEIIHLTDRTYRGNAFKVGLMNREFFTLLMIRFTTPKARSLQRRFVAAFFEQERRLAQYESNGHNPSWIDTRCQGKLARREETDVIKQFVEYATAQGSKKASFYYGHITNATYKALGLMVERNPKLRETMDMYELAELMLCERLARNRITEYMALGRNYHDIYDSVRDDLIAFGSSCRLAMPVAKALPSAKPG
jgi:phage regulator Rha-like protein